MKYFDHHIRLFGTALGLFVCLTILIALMPAWNNQQNNQALPNAHVLSDDEAAGKKIYISQGCVACHSQQVRNVEMDKMFGNRPSIAADYAGIGRTDFWRNTATLMGTERTGPDLINIGNRQPSAAWHLLHLFQPRAVVAQSIMPAYPWLFEIKQHKAPDDVELVVPALHRTGIKGSIVAKKEALQLVAYLQSLKQTPLPGENAALAFLYQKERPDTTNLRNPALPDGAHLYAQHCQSCHQANGEGLPGAFPPLKGSPVVNGDDLELYVNIIMRGYDLRPEYATMPAVGLNNNLSAEAVTAIINHERSNWSNHAEAVSAEAVKKIIDFIQLTENK